MVSVVVALEGTLDLFVKRTLTNVPPTLVVMVLFVMISSMVLAVLVSLVILAFFARPTSMNAPQTLAAMVLPVWML
jgi:hypothetical protein